ncbi:MAG TPA: hypothetical protein VNN77_12560 [candidate division Zixibacteria bacterium]|nr:hypothetical protein [candidate division Zixibacteria bacterium]
MSKVVGRELTPELYERLSGREVAAHEGKIIPIFTLDPAGWPHPALLSYYEVVARDSRTVDVALWKNSSTANNLRKTGKITLMITDRGVNYYLKARVARFDDEMEGVPQVSRIRLETEELLEDQEPNAEITGGMTYRRQADRQASDFALKVFHRLREAK